VRREGPFQSPAGYSDRTGSRYRRGTCLRTFSSLLDVLCDRHKSPFPPGLSFSTREQETGTLDISKSSSTRPAHRHGCCHPDCEQEDAARVPAPMPPSDRSRPSSRCSQGKGELLRTPRALGQGMAFFYLTQKNPNTLQSPARRRNRNKELPRNPLETHHPPQDRVFNAWASATR